MDKLNIPNGDWNYTGKEDHFIIWNGEGDAILGLNNEDITQLICDTGNTYLKAPVLPSELLRQRNELLKAAKHLLINLDDRTKNVEHKDWLNTFFKKEIELLKSIENE